MDLTGKHLTQMVELEVRQEQVVIFKAAIKNVLDRVQTIRKSLKFQEAKLEKLQALTLEQFIERELV